jgi:hypothetical protein
MTYIEKVGKLWYVMDKRLGVAVSLGFKTKEEAETARRHRNAHDLGQ